MKIQISGKLPYNKTIAALSVLSVFSGLITVLAGEIFLPLAVGVLSSLFVFEKRKYRPVSIASATAVLLIDVLTGILLASYAPITSIEIISLSALIAFLFARGKSKAETAFYVTALSAVMLIVSFLFIAFEETGVYTFSSARAFYSELYSALKQSTVESLTAFSAGEGVQLIDEQTATALFDNAVASLVAVIAITAFAISGIALKIFSAIAKRVSDRPDYLSEWRFVASSPVAYFFLVLVLVSFFTGGGSDTFSLTVTNLYTIFTAVFAYTGFGHLYRTLSAKRSSIFTTLLLVMGIVLLSSFAITLLSVFGVIFTIAYNKQIAGKSE